MKINLYKANKNPIIGITGTLNHACHRIYFDFLGFFPKYRIIISISKHSYYLCGFGEKIKKFPIKILFETDFDSNIPVWFRQKKYTLTVCITCDYLWNKISEKKN